MDMTIKQVSERLKMSGEKIRQMILEGRFPNARKYDPAKETSPFLIPEKDVVAFEKGRGKMRPFRRSRVGR